MAKTILYCVELVYQPQFNQNQRKNSFLTDFITPRACRDGPFS